jgi:hypothetical protein
MTKTKDALGNTPLHIACLMTPQNPQIYKNKLLTEKSILIKNNRGNTPLHNLAINCPSKAIFLKIPKKLLTENNLLNENNNGVSVLDCLRNNQRLDCIPYPILNKYKETLDREGNFEIILKNAKKEYTIELQIKIKSQIKIKK